MQEIQFKKSQNSKVQDIKFSLQSIKPEFGKKFETAVIEQIILDQDMLNTIKDIDHKDVAALKEEAMKLTISIRKLGEEYGYPVLATFGRNGEKEAFLNHFDGGEKLHEQKSAVKALIFFEYLLRTKILANDVVSKKRMEQMCLDIDKYGDFQCLAGIISKLNGMLTVLQTNGLEGRVANVKNAMIEGFCLEFLRDPETSAIADRIFDLYISEEMEIHNVVSLKNTLVGHFGKKDFEEDDNAKFISSEKKKEIFIEHVKQRLLSKESIAAVITAISIEIANMLLDEKEVKGYSYPDLVQLMKGIFSSVLYTQDESYISSLFQLENIERINDQGEKEEAVKVLGYQPKIAEIIHGIVANRISEIQIDPKTYEDISIVKNNTVNTGKEGKLAFKVVQIGNNKVVVKLEKDNRFISNKATDIWSVAILNKDFDKALEKEFQGTLQQIETLQNQMKLQNERDEIANSIAIKKQKITVLNQQIQVREKRTSAQYANTLKQKIEEAQLNFKEAKDKNHLLEEEFQKLNLESTDYKKKEKELEASRKVLNDCEGAVANNKNELDYEMNANTQVKYKKELDEKIKECKRLLESLQKESEELKRKDSVLEKQDSILKWQAELEKFTNDEQALEHLILEGADKYITQFFNKNIEGNKEKVQFLRDILHNNNSQIYQFLYLDSLECVASDRVTLADLKNISNMPSNLVKGMLGCRAHLDYSLIELEQLQKKDPMKFEALSSDIAIKAYRAGATFSDLSEKYDKEFNNINKLLNVNYFNAERTYAPIVVFINTAILFPALRALERFDDEEMPPPFYINTFTILLGIGTSIAFSIFVGAKIGPVLEKLYKQHIINNACNKSFSNLEKLYGDMNFYEATDSDKNTTYEMHKQQFTQCGFTKESEACKYLMQMPKYCIHELAKKLNLLKEKSNIEVQGNGERSIKELDKKIEKLDGLIMSTIMTEAGGNSLKFRDLGYAYIWTEMQVIEIAKMQKGFLIEGDQYVLSALPNVRKESDKIGKALELIFNKPEETKKVESYVVKYDDKIDKDVQSAIDKISIVQVKEILTKIANNLIKQRQETAMNI